MLSVHAAVDVDKLEHPCQRRDESAGVRARLGPAQLDTRQLALGLGGPREGRHRDRYTLEQMAPPLLGLLDALPVGDHGVRCRGSHVAKDVRMPGDKLVVHLAGDVLQGEQALFLGEPCVEQDLAQEIAELLGGMGDRRSRCEGRIVA